MYIFYKAKRLISISLGVAARKILFIIIMNNIECMNCKNSQHLYIQEEKCVNTFVNIQEITKLRAAQLCPSAF